MAKITNMNADIKKGLYFLLGTLLVFIGGMLAIDKVNADVTEDIEFIKQTIKDQEKLQEEASQTTPTLCQ